VLVIDDKENLAPVLVVGGSVGGGGRGGGGGGENPLDVGGWGGASGRGRGAGGGAFPSRRDRREMPVYLVRQLPLETKKKRAKGVLRPCSRVTLALHFVYEHALKNACCKTIA
jgi:hypothetical protein